MGWIAMSKKDLHRFEVLSEVVCGHRSVTSAAEMLEISPRQAHRVLSRLREGGPGTLAHRARGRPSNNRLSGEQRQKALALIGERYSDFGPTLAAEKLAECCRWTNLQPAPPARAGTHSGIVQGRHTAFPFLAINGVPKASPKRVVGQL